ncbi:MAG: hypothetical protein ACXQTY_05460 [Candidatus Methanogasteraceae archaeon]
MRSRMLLLVIAVALTASVAAGVPNATYPVSTDAICLMATAEPVINATSYNITLGITRDCITPYGFTGEPIDVTIDVTDDNGASDIATVELILSEDVSISADDTVVPLTHVVEVDATTATFGATWIVPSTSGLKHVLVNATDSTGLSATNKGIEVGEIFQNPLMGFEVKDGSGTALTTVSFAASAPGTNSVASDQNTIQITNTDPDGVGMRIKVSVVGTAMTSGANEIPVSNIRVDDTQLSVTPTEIDSTIDPLALASHNFKLDYPAGLVAGTYQGGIDFEVEAI